MRTFWSHPELVHGGVHHGNSLLHRHSLRAHALVGLAGVASDVRDRVVAGPIHSDTVQASFVDILRRERSRLRRNKSEMQRLEEKYRSRTLGSG